jgi:hypothetical protein
MKFTRLAKIVVLSAAFTIAHAANAQSCLPPEHPFFEYQVERPAKFVGDTAMRPRPSSKKSVEPSAEASPLIVAFVVDSAGVVSGGSLKILRSPSQAATVAVRDAYVAWKYRPAILGGCRVAQLVQTEVEP